jgi:hypothetical protein
VNERCTWKHCRSREIVLTYLGKPLCGRHWLRLCQLQESGQEAAARQMIGLRQVRRKRGVP